MTEPPPIVVRGPHDIRTIEQLERCTLAAPTLGGVLCADGHVGYSMPIGGVVAYREHVSPSGCGFDIACGVKGVRTELRAEDVTVAPVMDEIVRRISFGVGRVNDEPVDHPVLDEIADAEFAPQRKLLKRAAGQLGTVGAGNHWVDLFEDEEGWLWVGTHFGSRGFGHATASGFLSIAAGGRFEDRPPAESMDAPPALLHEDSAAGQAYIAAMELAGRYAYAGRDIVVDRVLEILGTRATESVHEHHNFAWRERHEDEDVWVVRKGCTPAFPGQRGVVGASMGDPAVVVEGVESPESRANLYSTVHGAGRAMSRTQAAGKLRKRVVDGKRIRVREGGRIDFEQVKADLRRKGVELRGGAADEAPGAYKRLDEVLRHHEGTVRVLHTLTPVGVAMAGADTYDPYKD